MNPEPAATKRPRGHPPGKRNKRLGRPKKDRAAAAAADTCSPPPNRKDPDSPVASSSHHQQKKRKKTPSGGGGDDDEETILVAAGLTREGLLAQCSAEHPKSKELLVSHFVGFLSLFAQAGEGTSDEELESLAMLVRDCARFGFDMERFQGQIQAIQTARERRARKLALREEKARLVESLEAKKIELNAALAAIESKQAALKDELEWTSPPVEVPRSHLSEAFKDKGQKETSSFHDNCLSRQSPLSIRRACSPSLAVRYCLAASHSPRLFKDKKKRARTERSRLDLGGILQIDSSFGRI